MQLYNFFERIIVINLKARPDRLTAFHAEFETPNWPFLKPEVYHAAHGNRLPIPKYFKAGAGAFGCRQSHVGVLQQALTDNVSSLMVLEDDATLCDEFLEHASIFISSVPEDWEGIMFGGEHKRTPVQFKPGIVRSVSTHRTHAYACRGRYMRGLFERWVDSDFHIDCKMDDWQHHYRVYAPEHFLIGQRRSKSDIEEAICSTRFWNPICDASPIIILDTPKNVVAQLRRKGYSFCDHLSEKLQKLCQATPVLQQFSNEDTACIRKYLAAVHHEDSRNCKNAKAFLVWIPNFKEGLIVDALRSASNRRIFTIRSRTFSDAFRQLPITVSETLQPQNIRRLVVLLRAEKHIVSYLRMNGIHTGYSRDPSTDYDLGLLRIVECESLEHKIRGLQSLVNVLIEEASCIMNGVVAVWHPKVSLELLRQAVQMPILELHIPDFNEAELALSKIHESHIAARDMIPEAYAHERQ